MGKSPGNCTLYLAGGLSSPNIHVDASAAALEHLLGGKSVAHRYLYQVTRPLCALTSLA